MRLTALTHAQVEAYLSRLGVSVHHTPQGLAELQAAHLRAVPFHNLWLLANDGRPCGLTPLQKLVEANARGEGGTCNRTTPPFTALLQALGFDAYLAAATVRQPGDHFVCVVRLDERRYLCDVGNGHPYLTPWDLDGPVQAQTFCGWQFHFEPDAAEGPALIRTFPDGSTKTVYTVDPTPKTYGDFAAVVSAHYSQPGFGPFLNALRAVRISEGNVLTLRDRTYVRDTHIVRSVRELAGREAFESLLQGPMGLPADLVRAALDVLARRRPELLDPPRWSKAKPTPPDVLVSLATVGRPVAVQRLLDTLAVEVRESGYPGRVGVLVVENHAPGVPALRVPQGLTLHRVPITSLRSALRRAAEVGVLPELGDILPVPIGAAREAQVAALREHLRVPVPGLPHPSSRPMVVWMVDDDLAFQQLGADGRVGRRTDLLARVARFWACSPQHSVIIGTFTGDPPIPGLDGLGGQLDDLAVNVARMSDRSPGAPWEPPAAPAPTRDAYYDLSESTDGPPDSVWPWAPGRAGQQVREVALALLRALPELLDGRQLTRPLCWDGEEAAPSPSLRRGGNALFLDLDALFRWPTPVLRCKDGVLTRRADTLWATLAQAEAPGAVVEATLPLLHGREGQGGQPSPTTSRRSAEKTAAQVRGTALARMLSSGQPAEVALRHREARVATHRQGLLERIAHLRSALRQLQCWADAEVSEQVTAGEAVLSALEERVQASIPVPGDPSELNAFLETLPEAVSAWRGAW